MPSNTAMTIRGAIALFLDECAVIRGSTPESVSGFALDLRRLTRFLSTRHIWPGRPITKVHYWHIQDFAMHLGTWLAISTQRRNLCTVRTMFRFLRSQNLVPYDPTRDLVLPRLPQRLPRFLTVPQCQALIAAPDLSDPRGLRNAALLHLLWASGLRIAEACGLSEADLYPKYVRVRRGKGGKERFVPISASARDLLVRYQREARPMLLVRPTGALFVTAHGALSTGWARRLVARYGLLAEIQEHVHPHLLRHSFATHLLHWGCELRAIQEMLGHASISSTEIYTHLTDPHLRAVYKRHHPRA